MVKEIDLTQMQKLVEKVEQIVSVVKDPQLKPLAFGKILDLLLHSGETGFMSKVSTERVGKVLKSKKTGKTKKSGGPKSWLQELVDEGFFKKPKNIKEILATFEERGHHLKASDLTLPLQTLAKGKQLRRKKQAPEGGGKPVWHYSNW